MNRLTDDCSPVTDACYFCTDHARDADDDGVLLGEQRDDRDRSYRNARGKPWTLTTTLNYPKVTLTSP